MSAGNGCSCNCNSSSYWEVLNQYLEEKEQGIMKYKEGDVLVTPSGSSQFKILAVSGQLYGMSELGDFDTFEEWGTESSVSECRLKTDDPKLTTLTMEDVAKMAGIDVDTLRIKD
jgi:hypothetical protein